MGVADLTVRQVTDRRRYAAAMTDHDAATETDATDAPRAVDGRVPGRRGRATREKLLDATAKLLDTENYRDVKVVDIARLAGTSPATFYQYFTDVEAAVLVLAERMADEGQELAAIVQDATWAGRAGYETVQGLVDTTLAFWQRHGAVLRVVDLAIAEGDPRFRALRNRLLQPVTSALRDEIARLASEDKHLEGVDPASQAASVVSMIVHVAAHRKGLAAWGAGDASIRESLARISYWGVTARRPREA